MTDMTDRQAKKLVLTEIQPWWVEKEYYHYCETLDDLLRQLFSLKIDG
jgi:hypothetical protein